MPRQVIMPQLGESVDEGTVTKWLVAVGQPVKELEPLLEVNTDKVDTEIPSPAAGVLLEILVPEGAIAKAGMVIAQIGAPDEISTPAAQPEPPQPQTNTAPAAVQPATAPPAPGRRAGLGFISPIVARMAAEFNIDLNKVTGSGEGGRITKKDLQAYLAAPAQAAPATAPASLPTPKPTAVPAPVQPAAPTAPPAAPGTLIPHTSLRRAIAEHMVHSKHTSPHVTTVMEVDLQRVVNHREANKAAFARDGARLTFTAYFVAATVAALKAHPQANSTWLDEGLLLHREINLGMAVALGEAGLIVPVIKNADALSLLGIARSVNDLADRARSRSLKPDEVKGGTFTITNHGTSGSLFASPIINQPQCGILGVGALQKRVVVLTQDGADLIAIRPMAYLSFTFDHRILDGASADGFLGKVVEFLQNWQ